MIVGNKSPLGVQTHPGSGVAPVLIGKVIPWLSIHANFRSFANLPEGKVLVLSAGDDPLRHKYEDERVAYPKGAIRSDLTHAAKKRHPDEPVPRALRTADLLSDNRRFLPFVDGAFHGLYLGRGICACPKAPAGCMCCGVPLQIPAIQAFLQEIVRVVDWQAPGAVAVLTGNYHPSGQETQLQRFAHALAGLRTSPPLIATFAKEPFVDFGPNGPEVGFLFNGLILRPANVASGDR